MLLEYYILYRTNADNKQQYVLNRPVFFQEFVLILCGKARELLGWLLWEAVRCFPYVWAKAVTVSDSFITSGIMYLKRGKNFCATAAGREVWEYVRETVWQTHRTVKKEGKCSKCWSWNTPAVCGKEHGKTGCACAAHGTWWNEDPPVACGGPHTGADGYPKEAVTLWEPLLEWALYRSCVSI